MRVSFSGFDNAVQFDSNSVGILEIGSRTLFARVCQALLSGAGEEALEPYTIWLDSGEAANHRTAFLAVPNPFDLPWKHRSLMNGLYKRMNAICLEDEKCRFLFEELGKRLESLLFGMSCQMHGDYGFGLEWEMDAVLKSMGYGASLESGVSLFDNLIMFVDYVADAGLNESLLFVNLSTFLADRELVQLCRRIVFHGIPTLMVEQRYVDLSVDFVNKLSIDLDLLEYCDACQPECTSSMQGRFCSIGFGAVAF